jgi:hypothetical protein
MHGPINVKSPNNTSKWQMGFNSAFEGLMKYLNHHLSHKITFLSAQLLYIFCEHNITSTDVVTYAVDAFRRT